MSPSAMEKRLMSTVLVFSMADVLEELIKQKKTESCPGCQVDHPSQTRHDCLVKSEEEHLTAHFETVFKTFHLLDVMNRFSENMGKVNGYRQLLLFLNVIVLDRLRSDVVKDTVYLLLEKRAKAKETEL